MIGGNVASKPLRSLLAVALAAFLMHCGDSSPAGMTSSVSSVSVTPAAVTLFVGQSAALTATPRDNAGRAPMGLAVAWSSSDTTKAVVSPTGLVTARDSGSAQIRAMIEGKSDSAATTVRLVPVASVTRLQAGR
jgi:uncharacterized protein YjdB